MESSPQEIQKIYSVLEIINDEREKEKSNTVEITSLQFKRTGIDEDEQYEILNMLKHKKDIIEWEEGGVFKLESGGIEILPRDIYKEQQGDLPFIPFGIKIKDNFDKYFKEIKKDYSRVTKKGTEWLPLRCKYHSHLLAKVQIPQKGIIKLKCIRCKEENVFIIKNGKIIKHRTKVFDKEF